MKKTKNIFKRILIFLVIASLVLTPAFADDISDLEAENNELESQLEEERARLEEIQAEIDDLESYIADLDAEMEKIQAIIDEYETQKTDKQSEVDVLQAQIDELDAEIDRQNEQIEAEYASMSMRIQFMYENVGDSYIEAILSSSTFSEAVQKIQYLLEIARYDRNQMKKIQGLVDEVKVLQADKEEQLTTVQAEIEEIEALEAAQESQQALLDETRALKNEQLEEASAEAFDVQEYMDNLNAAINSNRAEIEAIEAEYQRQLEEEAERRRQEEEERRRQEELRRQEEENNNGDDNGNDNGDDNNNSYDDNGDYNDSGSSGYIWPLPGYYYITSYFGDRSDDPDLANMPSAWYHYGIDVYAPGGTPIVAVQDGVVVLNEYWSSVGNVVIVYLSSGLYMEVHHMSASAVYVGQRVSQGDVVGYVGATGALSTGNHLHFGMSWYLASSYVNPLNYVPY